MPDLNRRGFLGLLGGVAAVVPTTAPTTDADVQRAGLWTFRWHGWREFQQQLVMFGVWTAHRDGDPENYYYATTGGVVSSAKDLWQLDCTMVHGWPRLTAIEQARLTPQAWDERKTQLRANALRILVEELRG